MLKVLYYINDLDRSNGGVYQYSLTLLKTLSESLHDKCIFYVYLSKENTDCENLSKIYSNIKIISNPIIDKNLLLKKKKRIEFINKFLRLLAPSRVLEVVKSTTPYSYFIEIEKIDVVHCPYPVLPQSDVNCPVITTIHDVQELHFPQFFSSGIRAWRAVNYKVFIDKSEAVIVSYQHVKDDIVKFFSKPQNQVHVCLLKMNELWFNKYHNNESFEVGNIEHHDNYILYPAATWEHKNHLKLLEAIQYLREELNYNINLICTGSKNAHYDNCIKPHIKKLDLEEQVHFLGVVDDELLYKLYQKAKAIVIPTLYEAGSFPLVESILMHLPVVCSNVTSLPETIKNKKFVFDPYDIEDIAKKIKLITSSQEYIEENIHNSKKVYKGLIDTGTVNKVYNVYESLAERGYE